MRQMTPEELKAWMDAREAVRFLEELEAGADYDKDELLAVLLAHEAGMGRLLV